MVYDLGTLPEVYDNHSIISVHLVFDCANRLELSRPELLAGVIRDA